MSSKSTPHIPALTSIRGVAAWWVVAYHFRDYMPLGNFEYLRTFFANGDLAVDLFFVLSGFVILLNYGESFTRLSYRTIRYFITARLARIYPLHLAMLLLFLLNPLALSIFSTTRKVGDQFDPSYFVLNLVMVHNWGFTNHLAWNVPSWSISTEWFAYLCFPLFALLVVRYVSRTSITISLMVLAFVLLALVFWVTGAPSIGSEITSLGLTRCVLEFFAGAMLCNLYRRHKFVSPLWPTALLTSAIGLIAIGIVLNVPNYLTMPASFCLVILALVIPTNPLASLCKSRILLFLGEISYSTYMTHYFVKDWVKFLLVKSNQPELLPTIIYIILTFGASILLYRTVEVPCRNLILSRARGNKGTGAVTTAQ